MTSNPQNLGKGTATTYRCGTLTYTKATLAKLLFWLLWGDFVFTLMESVLPSLMPLQFQALGASNTDIGVIQQTLPLIVFSIFNPVISFKSDRFRSSWGRRIPFILITLPLIVLCLIALAYGGPIGLWIHGHLGFIRHRFSPNTVAIWTLGLLLVTFSILNVCGTSVFWYLFNDVVPEHLLARFMSWIRMISLGAGALYNFFVFRYAGTHTSEILLGAAILYALGFGMMCLNVKEGQYPPPADYVRSETGLLAAIKTYAVECHSLPHYWYQWLCTFLGTMGSSIGAFGLLYALAMGLSKEQIGNLSGTYSIATAFLVVGAGLLADRYHPMRVVLVGTAFQIALVIPIGFIWLFWLPPPTTLFWIMMVFNIFLIAPGAALTGIWDPPLLMRLFPRARYGQFCSANSIWRSLGGIIGGILAGVFLDALTPIVGKDKAYLYIPIWQLFFALPSFYFAIQLFKSWKRHGGDACYIPPISQGIFSSSNS